MLFYLIYILFDIVAIVITIVAERYVVSTYKNCKDCYCNLNLSGAGVAKKILYDNGITDVTVGEINGELTDHYNHKKRQLNLSSEIFEGSSIASVAVAAHEAGHALQYKNGYFPIKIRNIVIPITNFASKLFLPFILIGAILTTVSTMQVFGDWFIYGSLIILGLSVLFNLVTLPVEFNASRRAMNELKNYFSVEDNELIAVKRMLKAAALTYVASLAVSLLYMLRYLLLFAHIFWENR